MVVADVEGKLLYWNRAALQMHGFSGGDKPGEEFAQLAARFELSTEKGVLPLEEWPLARIMRGERLQDLRIRIQSITERWQRTFSYGGGLARDPSGRGLLLWSR